ncbi:MmgE/PrpD family protein [Phyllobacterium sp. OV277]|uniref:MmgE/PrpD family protein n=1 Tax=Phyllobacterium sp. OV277 TaxID=1882772 RepID=UPI00089217C1|nr:MmgE/PrpD family protein [Phyllobacterium sp. OV277]SDP34317.1 2-methylcitrate dehydratase PrpD [Phyllobacterium sp. OV277]
MQETHIPITVALSKAILSSLPLDDAEAIKAARTALIDFFACALGGADDRSTKILMEVLASGSSGEAIVIGHAKRFDLFTATLINGHSGHVLDYDDVHASVRGHPTIAIIPALLSVAVQDKKSASDFIGAYVVGLETMARIGLAIGTKHYENGFHATATLGTIGAAAAIAYLLKFSEQTTAVALGLAATQSAGLRLQFGYDAKPLHAGLASRAGLMAARLAQAGFQGAPDFLDNRIGFFSAFSFGDEQPHHVLENWGKPWQIVSPGLTLKAFPCCTASHPVAVGALQLRETRKFEPGSIRAVNITFPPGGDAALVAGTSPNTGIDARFSAEYVFATALIDGELSIGHFDERPVRSDLLELAIKVTRSHDETARRLSPDPTTRFVVIDVTLNNGQRISHRVEGLPGISDPSEKFADATSGNPKFAGIPVLVRTMTSSEDLQTLAHLLNQNTN